MFVFAVMEVIDTLGNTTPFQMFKELKDAKAALKNLGNESILLDDGTRVARYSYEKYPLY